MKIKMPPNFDHNKYKALEEFFLAGKAPPFTALLDYDRSVFRVRKSGILLLGKKNGSNLESRIKIGKGAQDEDPGAKVKIEGYVRFRGLMDTESFIYQFDLLPDHNLPSDYLRCFLKKRDKDLSMRVHGELGFNSINPEQYGIVNPKENNSTDSPQPKTTPQNYNLATVYGTLQEYGGLYFEIDAVKIGQNHIVYHNKKKKIGI